MNNLYTWHCLPSCHFHWCKYDWWYGVAKVPKIDFLEVVRLRWITHVLMLRRNFCAIYQKENVFKCYASAQEKREKILEKRVRSSLLPLFIKGGKDEMTPTIWRFHLSLSLSIKHNGTKTAKQQSGEDNFLMVWRFFLSTSSLSTQSCSKGFPFLRLKCAGTWFYSDQKILSLYLAIWRKDLILS